MTLPPGSELVLECGEDIDHIAQAVVGEQRLLEQVKRLDDNVTLRNGDVLTAIANYIHHRSANPGHLLLFRFTSTADIGIERPALSPERRPGLELWRAGQQEAAAQERQTLRAFFTRVNQPAKVSEAAWKVFKAFWSEASDQEIREMLARFEWSCGAPESPALQDLVQVTLYSSGRVRSLAEAARQYAKLFVHVLRLLSERGDKRLHSQDLSAVLESETWTEEDERLFERVRSIETAVHELRELAARQALAMTKLQAQIGVIAIEAGVNVSATYVAYTLPDLSPPPTLPRRSLRQGSVEYVLRAVGDAPWFALHGVIGVGKTELALLVAAALGQVSAWIDFRGLNETATTMRFDAVTASLAGTVPGSDAIKQAMCSLGRGTVLVLDDLPRIRSNDLGRRLRLLMQQASEQGVRLVSTSHHPLPATLTEGPAGAVNVAAPLLDEREVQEVLLTHGMSGESQVARFIHALTEGHAALVTAAARLLAQHGWNLTNEALEALLRRSYGQEVQQETVERLLETVADSSGRELLYRLTLAPTTFQFRHAQVVANVQPEISHPREKLTSLLGLWVQQRAQGAYALSPLLTHLGADLTADVQRGTHLALANDTLAQQTLDQYDVSRVLVHLLGAEEPNRAGALWFWAVMQLKAQGVLAEATLITRLWMGLTLPAGMSVALRFAIRALQLQVFGSQTEDASFLLEELRSLVGQAQSSDAWALLSAFADRESTLARLDFRLACAVLTKITGVTSLEGMHGEPVALPEPGFLNNLIVLLTPRLHTLDNALAWLEVAEHTHNQGVYPLDTSLGWEALRQVAERRFMEEFERPAEQQDWRRALDDIRTFSAAARESSLPVIWAWSVEAQVIVQGEHLHDLNAALQTVEEALRLSRSPEDRVILYEAAGRQFFYQRQYEGAKPWLAHAVAEPAVQCGDVRVRAAMMLSACEGRADPHEACRIATAAVGFARGREDVDTTLFARACGDAAVAAWAVDRHVDAYSACREALLTLRRESDELQGWRETYVKLLHLVSRCVLDLRENETRVKRSIEAGHGEAYRHIFGAIHPHIAARYNPVNGAHEDAVMADFADLLGLADEAAWWAQRGLARPNITLASLASLSSHAVAGSLREQKYGEALDAALRGAAAMVGGMYAPQGPLEVTEADLHQLLGSRPGARREEVENIAIVSGVIPIAFQVADWIIRRPEQGVVMARECAELCRQTQVNAVFPQIWEEFADAFAMMGSDLVPRSIVIERANRATHAEQNSVATIWQLLATLRRDFSIREAARLHRSHATFLKRSLRGAKHDLYHTTASFFITYWCERIGSEDFSHYINSNIQNELMTASEQLDNKLELLLQILEAIEKGN
ncbi:hypothetical protein F8S09_17200 [Deinococcus sp. SDU3-2]|uniref:Uncharacterized protein n=1 Tax=Deinococcus terrestris TaxID=2651870 RepID=A0A7X1NZY1_9DEIO|nr:MULTISPECIES: hypothetical protein [Deinococcus]MPY68391.1 hypothetical protein [Deinococcus terrestris]